MPLRTLVRRITRSDLCWLIAIAIAVAVVVGSRAQSAQVRWPAAHDLGPVALMSGADIFVDEEGPGVIAPALATGDPLTFLGLNDSAAIEMLPYPDVAPQAWMAVAADAGTFHLVWQEQDNRLRSALIDRAGVTLRGPIELASAVERFSAAGGPDDGAIVMWVDAEHSVRAVVIDREGRPGPSYAPLASRVEAAAVTGDRSGHLHWVWATSSLPGQWTLYYQMTESAGQVLDAGRELAEVTLGYGAYATDLTVGLDETHGYAFWSTSSVRQPDVERIEVVSFPLADPGSATVTPLSLPEDYQPASASAEENAPVCYLDRRAGSGQAAAIRWLQPAPGQSAVLPVALLLFSDGQWHPVIAYFQHGNLLGEQWLSSRPAEGGRPAAAFANQGDLIATWTEMAGAGVRRYASRVVLADTPPETEPPGGLSRTLAGMIVALPFGLIWLIAPAALVLFAPRNVWTLRLAAALYGLGKLLLPRALFAHVPPLLLTLHIAWMGPGEIAGVAALLIALVALTPILAGGRERRSIARWAICAGVDVCLTCAVFGANLLA